MGCGASTDRDTVVYRDIRESLSTGDILMFSARTGSSMIKCGTCSSISHIGVVVRMMPAADSKAARETDGSILYIFHSTATPNAPSDVLTNQRKSGVQLNNLKRFLDSYDGTCYLRKFYKNSLFEVETRLASSEFVEWMNAKVLLPYPQSNDVLLNAVYDGPCGIKFGKRKDYFCSQLVADALMELGIIQLGMPADFIPSDFSEQDFDESTLLSGWKISPEFQVTLRASITAYKDED